MSYVELKHLLAALALEAVRDPARAGWAPVALACAERASPRESRFQWRDCLTRAVTLSAPFGWKPTRREITRLVKRGLFERRGDLIVIPPRFTAHLEYFKRQTARLLQALADLQGTKDPARIAAVLFNAGLYFECHEWCEGLWKGALGTSKDFYHGIVQVAAAFYHHEKGNRHGSRTLLGKGLAHLAPYPNVYLGIDLERLRGDLAPWTEHFAGGPRPTDVPRINLVQNQRELRGGNGSALEGWRGNGAP